MYCPELKKPDIWRKFSIMKKQGLYVILTIFFTFFLEVQEVLAGPGGKILRELFDTPLGKLVGVLLFIIFFPIIAYNYINEKLAVRRTRRDLQQLAAKQPVLFNWFDMKNRMTDVFERVHYAWRKEDMSAASDWMSHWYWQNQQMTYLDRWQEQGLVNVCIVRKVLDIKPIYLDCQSLESFEGTRLVASITANMEDYLAERETGRVVEGKKGFKNGNTVWTFVVDGGKWKVENIEESDATMAYSKLKNVLPAMLTVSSNAQHTPV
jgi:hypothetical protein